MPQHWLFWTFLFLTPLCLTGCSGPKPGDVYKDAVLKANEGKYQDADALLSDSLKKAFATEDALHKMWDSMTSHRTITTIEILKENTNRASSNIDLKVTFKDGTIKETKEMILKENGEWRLGSFNLTRSSPNPKEKKGFQNNP